MADIDRMVEEWTRDLHDAAFNPKIACDYCDESFRESDAFDNPHNTTLTFCSEECSTEWEQEQKEQQQEE